MNPFLANSIEINDALFSEYPASAEFAIPDIFATGLKKEIGMAIQKNLRRPELITPRDQTHGSLVFCSD